MLYPFITHNYENEIIFEWEHIKFDIYITLDGGGGCQHF